MEKKNETDIGELFIKLFPPETDAGFVEASKKLCEWDGRPRIDELRAYFCNIFLELYSDAPEYDPKYVFLEDPDLHAYCRVADKLSSDHGFYKGVAAFFRGDRRAAQRLLLKNIDDHRPTAEDPVTEYEIADFFVIFKNRFPAFWPALCEKYAGYGVSPEIIDLCRLIPRYLSCAMEERIDLLTDHLSRCPGSRFARERLGLDYYSMKMWRNAAACLENDDDPVAVKYNNLLYYLANAYLKCGELVSAEKTCRKCLDAYPDEPDVMNLLGYTLMKRKRYSEALSVFEKCLEENRDIPYSANNCVKTLLYLGRNKEALDIVNGGKYRIDKHITEKAVRAYREKRPAARITIEEGPDEAELTAERRAASEKSGMQFHLEKLLEDELEAKLNAGIPVFGKKLSIFRRPGEYGRQYVIPVGRLDLLCEDEEGDLYVVELKRDSGYDDAYAKTVQYMEWFEKSTRFKNKTIFGIICLNAPSNELIEKVRGNKRISLFEYSIRFSEIE
ncbi:MAG: DUF91 domain-containing protein [Clostridia bacterium]|nr:DUF91 domain-containing protein [Clostridia bacterium]